MSDRKLFASQHVPNELDEAPLTLELLPGGADIGHYVGYVTQNGGEQEEAEEELGGDINVLALRPGPGQVADGCEGLQVV